MSFVNTKHSSTGSTEKRVIAAHPTNNPVDLYHLQQQEVNDATENFTSYLTSCFHPTSREKFMITKLVKSLSIVDEDNFDSLLEEYLKQKKKLKKQRNDCIEGGWIRQKVYKPQTKKELENSINRRQKGHSEEVYFPNGWKNPQEDKNGDPIDNGINITKFFGPMNDWDITLITDLSGLFRFNMTFNEPIEKWDTSNATNMSQMFRAAEAFNQSLVDLTPPKIKILAMSHEHCYSFIMAMHCVRQEGGKRRFVRKLPVFLIRNILSSTFGKLIKGWNTEQVKSMAEMFDGAEAFNQPVNHFDTRNVETMFRMFHSTNAFNQQIDQFDVNVYDMTGMLHNAKAYKQPFGKLESRKKEILDGGFSKAIKARISASKK
jgi:surface protein